MGSYNLYSRATGSNSVITVIISIAELLGVSQL